MNSAVGTRNAEPNPTLVCFALKEEARAFERQVTDKPSISVLITGMGRENSQSSLLKHLETLHPARAFTCGFAGGLNPELKVGDVVFQTVDPRLNTALVRAGAQPANFVCASRIATTVAEKAELRRATRADVVEMESEAIQEICRQRGIPCATVRAISDTAGEDLPLDFNRLSNADWSLNYRKLIVAVLSSPGKIPALLRLQKHSSRAAESLATVLTKVLGPGQTS